MIILEWNILIVAAARGHAQAAKFFISKGMDVSYQNEYGESALLISSIMGKTSVMDILIENGANVDSKNKLGICMIYF